MLCDYYYNVIILLLQHSYIHLTTASKGVFYKRKSAAIKTQNTMLFLACGRTIPLLNPFSFGIYSTFYIQLMTGR